MKLFDIDKLVENLTGYIETKIELIQLDVKEELTQLIAKVFAYSIIALFAIFAVTFISIGLSTLLNDYLDSYYLGYLIIGLLYLILTVVFYGIRTRVIEKVKANANQDSDKTDVL